MEACKAGIYLFGERLLPDLDGVLADLAGVLLRWVFDLSFCTDVALLREGLFVSADLTFFAGWDDLEVCGLVTREDFDSLRLLLAGAVRVSVRFDLAGAVRVSV
jgi:hypothetical protein